MIPIVILLALVFWFYESTTTTTVPAGIAPPDGSVPPPPTTSGGIPLSEPGCGGLGGFIESHVQRKDALAPLIINKETGIPMGPAGSIANVASQLDISGYAEKAIGSAVGSRLCNLSPLHAAAAGAKFIAGETVRGFKGVAS